MHLRRLISFVAILGMLLHAGVLVRHNGLMLNAMLQYQGLVADLTEMCHGGATASGSELPSIPRPTGAEFGCPVCAGLVAAVAIAANVQTPIAWSASDHMQPPRILSRPAGIDRWSLPPARAPPVSV